MVLTILFIFIKLMDCKCTNYACKTNNSAKGGV